MSTAAARRALEEQMREPIPQGVAALGEEELRHLADAVRAARHRQAEALQEAGERAFGYIPRLLRGPIRKIVG